MSDKQPYIVKRPIAYMGSRFEAGEEVYMTQEEAQNIGDEFVKPKKGEETPAAEMLPLEPEPQGDGGSGEQGGSAWTDTPSEGGEPNGGENAGV